MENFEDYITFSDWSGLMYPQKARKGIPTEMSYPGQRAQCRVDNSGRGTHGCNTSIAIFKNFLKIFSIQGMFSTSTVQPQPPQGTIEYVCRLPRKIFRPPCLEKLHRNGYYVGICSPSMPGYNGEAK
jgi:hypothetical protein